MCLCFVFGPKGQKDFTHPLNTVPVQQTTLGFEVLDPLAAEKIEAEHFFSYHLDEHLPFFNTSEVSNIEILASISEGKDFNKWLLFDGQWELQGTPSCEELGDYHMNIFFQEDGVTFLVPFLVVVKDTEKCGEFSYFIWCSLVGIFCGLSCFVSCLCCKLKASFRKREEEKKSKVMQWVPFFEEEGCYRIDKKTSNQLLLSIESIKIPEQELTGQSKSTSPPQRPYKRTFRKPPPKKVEEEQKSDIQLAIVLENEATPVSEKKED